MGCGGTIKNSWTNFRAYYNTYYNAKENFRTGLEKVENQPVELNVNEPIRVHRPPVSSGDQDFQNAIDKGAQILRKFPDSKWVDETLALIGKSYYYRQEYYAALQKFEEQYSVAETREIQQRAVVWKGRVLLELQQYNDGIVFLENQLSELSGEWIPELRGETEILLAEHYVQEQEWEQAQDLLTRALPKLSKGPLKARTHFLHGQVLEIQDKFGEAAFAYGQVQNNIPGFELLYWSNYKRAEAFRKMGNLDNALTIYERMRRDDKNIERLAEINYQIARTEEAKENIELAEKLYKQILRNESFQLSQQTQADIYYRLGQIYTNDLNSYELAAAYYDSSSSLRSTTASTGVLGEDLDTETLAEAYGQYSSLRNTITRLDSLMWLGSLPQAQFDSVIAAIEERRLQQLQQNQRNSSNVLTNVNNGQTSVGNSSSGAYGFLNHRNSRLMTEARLQFRAVWGNRALVDNWRRIETVRSNNQSGSNDTMTTSSETLPEQGRLAQIQVDMSEIPFTDEEKQETMSQLAAARYELGNLFLTTLQQPDSAAYYFKTMLEKHPNHEYVPQALYSLYQLYSSGNQSEEAAQWAQRLIEEYPDSQYTRELRQRRGDATTADNTPERNLSERAASILTSAASTDEIAKELRNLALANKSTSTAPILHYEAIKQYIKLAKEHSEIESNTADSLVTDSVAAPEQNKRYHGAYWDSVRVILSEHQQFFSGQSLSEQVNKLSEELGEVPAADDEKSAISTCEERGVEPEIQQGMAGFLKSVKLPAKLSEAALSGTVDYEFIITTKGKVEGYSLVSNKTDLGIEEAFEEAFENNLVFSPLDIDDTATLRCTISFPISQ